MSVAMSIEITIAITRVQTNECSSGLDECS